VEQFGRTTVIDLASQPLDANLDDVSTGIEMVFPHVLAKRGLCDDTPRVSHQILQQSELTIR
jgi:hypothetical protein